MPGHYIFFTPEQQLPSLPVLIYGETTIGKDGSNIQVDVKATTVKLHDLVVTMRDTQDQEAWGRIEYWREPNNKAGAEVPVKGTTIKVVEGAEYTFMPEPLSVQAVAKPLKIVPGQVKEGKLVLPLQSVQPSLIYTWKFADDITAASVDPKARLLVQLFEMQEGKCTLLHQPGISSVKAVGKGNGDRSDTIYGLGEGSYAIEAKVLGDGFYTAVLRSKIVEFTIERDQKQTPAVELVLTKEGVGRIEAKVFGKNGTPVQNAVVGLRLGSAQVWSGKTNHVGVIETPSLPYGKYTLVTQASGLPYREFKIDLNKGIMPSNCSYAKLMTITATWPKKMPMPSRVEASVYPLNLSSRKRIAQANRDSVTCDIFPEELPALLIVYAAPPVKNTPPLVATLLVKNTQLPMELAPPISIANVRITAPKEFLSPKASKSVWFVSDSETGPKAMFPLRASRTWSSTTQDIGNGLLTIEGKIRLEPGMYHAMCIDRNTDTALYLNHVIVEPTRQVQVNIDISTHNKKNSKPIQELYKMIQKHDVKAD
jgi:hypothetical protein